LDWLGVVIMGIVFGCMFAYGLLAWYTYW
jgi:hypothetical protein